MNKIVLLLSGLFVASIAGAAEERVFALATAGEVDSALAGRVRAHLEATAGVAVRAAPAIAVAPGQSLEDTGRAAAATLAETDHSVIVLARADADQPQGVCLPHERFAILNLARLEAGAEPDRVERRIGQEGLRVMAMLLDMAPCPFPLCVLVGYEKTEDLDRMSGNFCPPCTDRFARIARAAGLRLIAPAELEPVAEPIPASAAEPAPVAAE